MAVVIRDDSNVPRLLYALRQLEGMRVEVGIWGDGDEHLLMVARVNEFGVSIEVTPKMRAYLHHQGLHLKKSTTHINIPERSYMRSSWDESLEELHRIIDTLVPQVVGLRLTPPRFGARLGEWMASVAREHLRKLKGPPNHPFTVSQKGSSNPLIDSGRLRQAITYRVVGL